MTLSIFVLCLAAVLQQSARHTEAIKIAGLTSKAAEKEIVDKHNALRRSVKPPASNMLRMEWDPKAAKNAQQWAEKCTFSHSPGRKRTVNGTLCGENIFMATAAASWSTAIESWYDESKYYKYGVGPVNPGAMTGHYTQVVWYKSYRVGCYATFCPRAMFKYYYVCHYCPAGNMEGSLKTPYKLGIPCRDCPSTCDNGLCTNPCKHEDEFSNCGGLARRVGCENAFIKHFCPASCVCTSEIK